MYTHTCIYICTSMVIITAYYSLPILSKQPLPHNSTRESRGERDTNNKARTNLRPHLQPLPLHAGLIGHHDEKLKLSRRRRRDGRPGRVSRRRRHGAGLEGRVAPGRSWSGHSVVVAAAAGEGVEAACGASCPW
jgi:hypothetical protein